MTQACDYPYRKSRLDSALIMFSFDPIWDKKDRLL